MQAMKLMPAPDLCHLSQVEELLTVPQDALQACHQFGIQTMENWEIPCVAKFKISNGAMERLYLLLIALGCHQGLDTNDPRYAETMKILEPIREAVSVLLDTDIRRTGQMVQVGVLLVAGPSKALEAKAAYAQVLEETNKELFACDNLRQHAVDIIAKSKTKHVKQAITSVCCTCQLMVAMPSNIIRLKGTGSFTM